jgi:hypothetical protein
MMWFLGIIVLLVAALVVWAMLRTATGRGGELEGDAAEMASQVIAQSAAFRGDRTDDYERWDGEERLKGLQGNEAGGA